MQSKQERDNYVNKPLVIAFDVDDTLIVPAIATGFERDVPNYDTINIYKWFQSQGNTMIIWSGGGAEYAKEWAEKLGLVADFYLDKHYTFGDGAYVVDGPVKPDIAFDDSDITLAKVNVKVKRVANNVVRYPDRVEKAKVVLTQEGPSAPLGVV